MFAGTGISTVANLYAQDRIDLNEEPGIYSVFASNQAELENLFGNSGEFITRQVLSVELNSLERQSFSDQADLLINPVFRDSQGNLAHADNRINVYMANPMTEQELEQWLSANDIPMGVEHKSWREGRSARYHTLTILPPYQGVSIVASANRLLEHQDVDIAYPNLIHQAVPQSMLGITDPLYEDQWIHGKIESELAWMLTKGSSDITIGVLDNGVDYNHPNLTDNILRDGQGNVLGGDFTSDNNPTAFPYGDESHGTQVAGLAAAPVNDLGMVGAAPQASIVPLKIATGQTGTARAWSVDQTGFADALDYATLNDIDILVASWGLQWDVTNGLMDQSFEDAIEDGRDGKGIVIVFAAGNAGDSHPVEVVAHRDEVITVGATTPSDLKWDYSSYPTGYFDPLFVDIAAPSGNTGTTPSTLNWSTDISGSNGVSSDDHWHFGGTSAAAPLVAGAAALLLSMDPYLTHNDVKDLLYQNADKVGGYSYTGTGGKSAELGHGRLNAFRAVVHALPDQFDSYFFSGNQTLNSTHIFNISQSETIHEFGTLTIPSDKVVVINGTYMGFGADWAEIVVNGRLVIHHDADVSGVKLTVNNGGILIVQENATLSTTPIQVNAGGELRVRPGTDISLGSGQSILSYGKVEMDGVTVRKAGSPRWNAFTLQGSGASGSVIRNATIRESTHGLRIIGAGSVKVLDSDIHDHLYNGLYAYGASGLQVKETEFKSNGESGILVDMSSVYFHPLSRFSSNSADGIRAEGGSWFTFGSVGEEAFTWSVGNSNGVHALDYTFIELGGSYGGDPYGGGNTIRSNSSYNARAQNNSYIEAQYTWWGSSNPPSSMFLASGGSVIDYSNWLGHPAFKMLPSGESVHPEALRRAEAIAMLRRAQRELGETASSYVEDEDTAVRRSALIIALSEAAQQADVNATRELAGRLRSAGVSHAEEALLLRALFLAELTAGSPARAAGYLDELTDTGDTVLVRNLRAVLPDGVAAEERAVTQADGGAGQLLALSSYPNPFNPVAVLRYELPDRGQVRLSVYDILGREVSRLVDMHQSAGSHQASFDGRALASGIYVYRLEFEPQTTGSARQVVTGKMLLVK